MAVGSSLQLSSRDLTVGRCEAQVKRPRRYPRVNPFRWIKKDRKKKSRHSRSSHQISRRSEEKTLSSARGGADPSTCISKDPTSNTDEDPLHGGLFKNIQGRKRFRTKEESGHGTASHPHLPGEAVDSGDNQEKIIKGSGLRRDPRVTEDTKRDGQPPEGSPVPTNMDCHHQEDSRLDGDSKALPVSEVSDLLMESNSESPSEMGPPKTENVEGLRSPPIKVTAPHHKKDRHVKFSEVVTMILIGERSEARAKERLLPVCNNVNDGDTKSKMEKTSTGQDLVHIPSQSKSTPPKNVGAKKLKRKRAAVSSCEATEAGSSRLDPLKGSKRKIVEGAGTSQRAPSPESPTKQTLKQQHELRVVCQPIMKNEDGKVCLGPPPPNTPPKNHEQKFIKSYSCANCGKITHWSKLNVQQKEHIERCMAHTCRMCGRRAAPAQKIRPLTTAPQPLTSDDSSQPDNQRIPAYSSDQTESPQILSAEKQQRRHKVEMKDEGTTMKSGNLITGSDRRTKGPKSQDDTKSSVDKKCGNPGTTVDPKPKTLHPKLKMEGPSSTAPGLESRKNKVLTKVNNVSGNCGDSKEHEGCAKNGTCYITEERKGQHTANEQKKPSVTHKMQDDLRPTEKTPSAYENLTSDKCAKCGKSLKKHLNPENPGEGGENNCVLRLKKKLRGPPRGEEPFECKQCGKTFTRHFTLLQHRTIHTGERPYSCKECGKTFRDNGYLKVHMRSHTKEKPYTCSECGKRFGQNSAMVAHLRIHTDERPFKCNECGKRFSDRSTFRHHQMIHTGEKPFTCSFCGKKFTQQAHVKRHEKMHTGERPFGCTMCEKRFVDRTKLRKHELTHTRRKD